MASELSNNVRDFTETNKIFFLQYEAESALSVEESSESVVVIPPPQRFITNVLLNRKVSYPQLKQSTSLGHAKQYNAIVNFILR